MRCLMIVAVLCITSTCGADAPWVADISSVSDVSVTPEGGSDGIVIWLPSGERATVGVYGGTETIEVDAPPEVATQVLVQFVWERRVFYKEPGEHVAHIPYWLPSRRWRPPGSETGGPYSLQLHATAVGDYRVKITCTYGEVLTVDLHVVEPVPDPDMGFGYYTVPPFWSYMEFRKYFEQMASERCNTFTLYSSHPFPCPITDDPSATDPTKQTVRAQNIAWQMDLAVETGLTDGRAPVFQFVHWPADMDEAYEYGRYTDQWPELLGYGRDEPPCTDQGEWEARGMVEMFNNGGYRSGSAMSDKNIYRIGDGIDIWICHMQDYNDTIKREAARQGKELWVYSCHMRGTNAPMNRYWSGWWAFANRPAVMLNWGYMDNMLAYGLDEPSSVQPDGRWTPCGYYEYHLGAPDGPISSVGAEARRDGIVDYMVLRELERSMLAARVNEPEDFEYYLLIGEVGTWLQTNVDRVDTQLWPGNQVPWTGPDGVPMHWDGLDLLVPPITDFNTLRRQAIEYTQRLQAGPRSD